MTPAKATATAEESAGSGHKDSLREIVETVVFVIVLVLLLKTFVAEAFVIPTGSMATTLYGHHLWVTCPQCGYVFTVNASNEVDEQDLNRGVVTGCKCQNCRYVIEGQELMSIVGKSP